MNLNVKLAIHEEIWKIQLILLDKIVVDKVSKIKIKFVNDNNSNMFEHNKSIVEKMVNETFKYTHPVEIVSALKKVN